jgi:hypothetical protein
VGQGPCLGRGQRIVRCPSTKTSNISGTERNTQHSRLDQQLERSDFLARITPITTALGHSACSRLHTSDRKIADHSQRYRAFVWPKGSLRVGLQRASDIHPFSALTWLRCLDPRAILTESRTWAFSATHFPGHCFRLIPASCSFASSAFPVPPQELWVPSHKAAARFGSRSPRFWVPQENGARKRRFKKCLTYMLSGIASG